MDVDFNSLRKQLCFSYDRLATILNEKITEQYGEKAITVSVEDIQDEMDELRFLIMSMAWTQIKDNENFKFVGEEVQPIAWFNKEEEDSE